jgi:large subunit ribosomal protein L6
MSRVGKLPVKIPDKVKVQVVDGDIKIEGPKGKMHFPHNPKVKVEVVGKEVKVSRPDESRLAKGLHGLTRTLVKNAIEGVVKGYEQTLEITGVGFKAEAKGKSLNFVSATPTLSFPLPEGVTAEVDPKQTKVVVRSADKHLLGLTAAKIRALRPPEPYKGKGVKYAEEIVRRKEGKTGAARAASLMRQLIGRQRKEEDEWPATDARESARRASGRSSAAPPAPRLTVYKSLKHMYAQIVDDTAGRTVVAVSTGSKSLRDAVKDDDKTGAAKKVGAAIAKAALEKGVTHVVFDRNGFDYHGRVAAVAEAAREAGLQF